MDETNTIDVDSSAGCPKDDTNFIASSADVKSEYDSDDDEFNEKDQITLIKPKEANCTTENCNEYNFIIHNNIKLEEYEIHTDKDDAKVKIEEIEIGPGDCFDSTYKLESLNGKAVKAHRKYEMCNCKNKPQSDTESSVRKNKKSDSSKCTICRKANVTPKSLRQKLDMPLAEAPSKVKWYKCDACEYKVDRKYLLKSHVLVHKNISEIEWYGCDSCDYKSKRKSYLIYHMRIHKDPSQIKWYKCDLCDYQGKAKVYLKRHMIIHKDSSEVKWHKCDFCDYKSQWKCDLTSHMLIHKNPSEILWYKCYLCDYQGKEKAYLKRHMLTHKDPSQIRWHKCDLCSYTTKRKYYLNTHKLIHQEGLDVNCLKCDLCDYKTNRKDNLYSHSLAHKRKWYKCDSCDYQSNRKVTLRAHVLIHKKEKTGLNLD